MWPAYSRRRFVQGSLTLAAVALLAGCSRLPAQAQPSAKIPRIAVLTNTPRTPSDGAQRVLDALSKLGYVEGQTMTVEWRVAETTERLPALVAELVALPADLILSSGGETAQAAKRATSTIPIVLIGHTDPVGTGLVASLRQPGGNITGTTNYSPELAGKRLQTLREVTGSSGPIAYLVNPANPSFATQEREITQAAGALGDQLIRLEARTATDLPTAIATANAQQAAGLVLLGDSMLLLPERARIAELALQWRLPSVSGNRLHVEAGGLMGYGDNLAERYETTAKIVDKISKGAKPADLPMEGPTRFDLSVNLKTAQALGLSIPQSVLAQATAVIQ